MICSVQAPQSSERRAGRNGAEAAKCAANRGFCWLLAVFGCLAAWGQPAAPTGLSASVGDARAYLSWTAASGATGYQVRHGTGSPPAFDVWTTIASTTTATVSGLTNGTRYAFEVRAVSALGSGAAARVWAALATSPSAAVTIPDAALRRQVEIWSRQSAGDTITQLEMANMSTLAGENLGISSLSGLEHALNLRLLHLGGNSITDISELYGLLSLGNLSLDRNSIFDISPLSRLTSLTWLTLTENNVSDLSALTNLTALRYLYLWQNRITNISHLSGLTELFDLQLGGNSISDVSALANMTALEGLNLSRNRLSNISSLSNLTALRVLDLSRNQISNVSSLSGLTALTRLNLLTNSISDIAPLSNLTALTWLALANNDISDISALSNLTALQRLYLSHNSISNVSSLSGLTALTLLDLFNNNSLSDISPLSTLTTLTVMSLASNMISDISHLSNLRSLRTLYLSDNSISDISHLSGLTALSSLRLAENTISDISALVANAGLATGDSVDLRTNVLNVAAVQTHIPALQTRGVTVRFDPPSAAVSATNPTPLVEGSLNNATVTVTLNSTAFASGVSASSFTLTTDVPGLTIDSVATVASGATSATLTLAHAGANFDTNRTLSVTVAAAAHMLSGDLATASVAVAPERGVTVDPTSLSLHEDPAAGGATNANVGTYSVVLTGEPQGDVTVTATSADDAVTLAADTTPLTTALTFTTSTWSTAQTVTATARQDDDEADESVLVTHTVSGYGDVTTARSVTVAVDDDEPPTAAITSPAILTSSVLPIGTGNPTISLLLTGSTFVSGVGPSSFELVTGLTTISIASATTTPGSAIATLTISRGGATSWDKKFAVKVLASAHAGDTDITTPPIDAVLQDTAPSFQSATLPTRYVHRGEAIAPFQIPAASGGNDAIRYTAANLLDGLKFDATGTDANGCTAADFPAGTAAAWATAPRTVCGATTMTGSARAIFHAHDSDSNEADSDRASLSLDIFVVWANLHDTNPSPLAEAGLNGATGNLRLYNTAFVSDVTPASFELVTTIPGLSIASITANPGTDRATVTLAFSGDFDTPQTLALKIKAAAHNRSFDIVTEALTVNPQPPADTAPTFGASTVPDQYVVLHEAMAPLQIPAASGGNGAISYVASAVRQQGIKFDATGTDADGCTASDFPSGTDAVWATAPRTLCGTPTGFVSLGISIHAHDADSNRANTDRDTLSVTMLRVSAAISTTTPSTLTEASLNSATIEVQLVNTTFSSGIAAASFELVTDIPSITISQVSGGTSGSATSTLTLAFTGDFGTPETLAVRVKATAHNRSGDLTTNALTIDPQGLVDTMPTFGTSTVPALYFRDGVAIAPVQLPAASGGNGALSYSVSGGQLFGLKFDATGMDADGCTASDFPPGTAPSWATAPRTLCGTPTGAGSSDTAILRVQDADSNRVPADQSALAFEVNIYGASITSTTPSALTGTNLHDATVSVLLLNAAFASGVTAASFELVTDVPGVSVSGLSGGAAATANATLTLAFTGDFSATSTLAVKVLSAASNRGGDLTTNAVTVAPADTEPVFPSVAAKSFLPNVAIAPFQIPAAVGGNGAVSYAIAGLPAGLKLDLTGTDAGGCTGSDFPAGTAASWATEPRTICGTPTSDAESVVVFSATDEDGDVGRLTFRVTVARPAALLGDTVPATLTEANLHGATVIVALARTSFASGVTKASFELITTIPGLEISSISTVAEGDTQATLTLAFTGDFTGARTIAVKVSAAAHLEAGDLTTGTLSVAATPSATIAATSPATLAESNLDGATLTVTLADTSFASGVTASSFTLTTDVPGLTIGSATAPPAGATSTLTLAYTGANFDEASSLTVTVAAAAHALVGDLTTGAVTVAPTRGVTLSTSTLTVQENNSATYTVRLASRPTGGDVTVTITGASSDITVSATSLTFTGTNWNTPQQVRVAAAEDGNSIHESVTLTHTPSGAGTDYAGVTPAELDVTAADNDTPGLGVDPQMLRIDEGTEATYAVRLNTDPGGSVTVTVAGATAAVTADTDGDRVNGNQNTLTFNSSNWDTPQTVTVSVPEDDNDTDESATLTHAASGASYTGLDASARPSVAVTVDDNDTPAVLIDTDPTTAEIDGGALAVTENQSVEYTVRLKTQPTDTVTVTATSAAPAVTLDEDTTPSTTALTFTTSTWATAQTVTATAQEDADSADELVSVTHTVTGYSTTTAPAVTVMVFDDDASITLTVDDDAVSEDDGATTITVTATLASATRFAKTVQVSVAGSGTAAAVDFAAVSAFNITIAAGAASGTGTFTLTPIDDAVHEADETITVSGTSGTLTVNSATITLTDDQALPTVALSLSPTSIGEAGGASTVTATLSAASSAAVTLTVTAATGTNAVAADFSLSTAKTLTIAAGATTSTGAVTVTAVDNDVDAANKSVTVSATVTGGNGVAAPSSVTLTLTDDETAGVTFNPTTLTLTEEGPSQSFTVVLDSEPTGGIDGTTWVRLTRSDAELDLNGALTYPYNLSFTPSNWDTPQMVTVTALGDSDPADDTKQIRYTVAGYAGGEVTNQLAVEVTVIDDDKPTVSLSLSPSSISENGGEATVTATLDAASPATTTIMVTAATGTNAVAGDFALSSAKTLTIAAGSTTSTGTVTITAVDNIIDEPNKSVTVSGSASNSDGVKQPADLTLTITDDDATPTSITLTVDDNDVAEDDGATTITVTAAVDGPTRFGGTRTVTVSVAGSGTATAVDFTPVLDFDIEIATGAASATGTFMLIPADDALDETDEMVTVSGASGSLTVNPATIDLTDDDATPSITLTVDDDSVGEGDGATTITVTATVGGTTRFAATTTVRVSVAGSGTAAAVDFAAVPDFDIEIAAAAATSTANFVLTPTDDALDETDETITVNGSSGSLTVNSDTITLADDDATPSLSIDSPIVAEGNAGAKDMTFTVTLSAASGQQVTVDYAVDSTDPGTATAGTDYAAVPPGTLTFASGATSRTIAVSVTGDTAVEPDETVRLALSGATNATLGAAIGVGTIVNEDGASLIAIDADPTTANVIEPGPLALQELLTDSANSKSYSVRLRTPPTQDVTVTITSGDTDAVTVGDTDGVMPGVQSTLTFTTSTWNTARTVTLTAAQDDDGVDESVTVTHAASTASDSEYTGDSASLTATVADDETPALVLDAGPVALVEGHATDVAKTYSVRLATEPTQTVTVTLTSGDAGAVSIDDTDGDNTNGVQSTLVFASTTWDTVQTVTARAVDDHDAKDESVVLGAAASTATPSEYTNLTASLVATVDDDETRAVTLSTSTLSVQENGSATYTVQLSSQPVGGNVTVTISGAGGGIAASPTSLTFTGTNWNTPQQVRVSAARDSDSDDETATLTHTPSGAGTDYATGVATAQIVVTATDIDPPGLQVSPTQLAVAEGASRTYTVRLNTNPRGTVTVTATSNDAAVALDADSTPQARTLTFNASNWNTPQTVTVSAVEDDNATDETATVTHAASGASAYTGLTGGALPSVQVSVDDNDPRGIVIDADPSTPNDIDAGPLAVTENQSAQYTVRLATQPTGTVTVTATSPDAALAVDSDASPLERTLTFTTSTWATAQTVTARALDDDDGGNETTAVAHAALGGDYGGVSAELSTTVTDDDPRGLTLVATSTLAGLDENDSGTYTVALSTQPTGPVTVAIASSDASAATVDADDAAAGAQSTVTFTTSTWATARTVTVSALDDDDGFDETVTLTHDPSGADYGSVSNATFAFTLDDDDPRGVVLSTSTLMVQENGSATYTVKLRAQPVGGAVTVTIASGGSGITVNPTSLTFNGANWNTPRQVRLSAAEDGNSIHESVVVRHTPSGADYGGVPPADLTATAVDNDRPGLQVSPTQLAVAEGASRTYTVRLNSDPRGTVTVTATSNDAAVTLDADSTPQERTLTFDSSNWDTPQTVTASAVDDDNATDESVTVTHAASGASAYTGLAGGALPSVQVSVDDNDARGIVIDADPSTPNDVDAGPLAVTENQSAQYTVRLATQPTGTVTVTATSPDAALAVDSDASPLERTLTFTTSTWATAQTVTARALDDDDGGNETTAIAHAALGGGYGGVSESLTAETADDDPRRVLAGSPIALDEGGMASSTARLSTQPTGTVTVAIADDHPDVTVAPPPTLTFDAATWNTAQTFTIRAGEDLDGEDETATLTFDPRGADYDGAPSATSTVNLADDDPRGVTLSESTLAVPEGGSATYTVRLDTRPEGGDVTVTVGGAGSGISASPTALTFTGTNWNAPRTVRVSAAEDDNPTHESVDLTHTVAGADYGREGVTADDVTATATDNDTPSLRVAPTALALVEEGADGFYAVRLNTPPSGDVTVTVGGATASVSVDADGGAPGAQTAMTFTTTDWATAQTVTVGAPADDDASDAATTLTHSVSGPGDYAGLGPAARPGVSVTVDDDDAPALVIDADPTTPNDADPGPLALHEQPGHAANAKEYTVRLATRPTQAVRVSIESGDRAVSVDGDATPRTRTLTFSTSTWSAAQTVTATAAQDDDASAETVAISHEADGGDYDDVSANLAATTVDDDAPALLLATSTLAASGVAEGGTQTYTVRLATEPSGTVTVAATATATATARVEVDMDGGQAGAQSSLRFDATNWNSPRTATVRGLEDDDAADGTATLRHSASGADYGSVEAADETFAVTDDDAPAVLPSATAVTVNEGSTAAYTVRLATRPVGGDVTVAATSANASTATVQPAQLRFGAGDWDVPKTFRVHGAQAGSATISHSASGADYRGAATTTVAATVRGTQAAGVRIEPPTLTLREGESGAYAVRLNTDPGGDVTVTATSGSAELAVDADATPRTKQLTFTTENWDREQTVTATALSDDGVDDETATVTHAVAGYAGVATAPDLVVAVRDDDAPGLLFEPAEGLQLEESGAAGTYTARLRFAPSAPVAVAVSSDDAGVAVDTDSGTPLDQDTLTFDATNWSTAQTVTVRAEADGDAASETATLLHAASGAGSGYEGVTATYAVRVSDADAVPAPTGVSASAAGPTSLAVRWTPSAGAEGHAVQWRRAGQAWSTSRQLTLPAGASSARIDGLATGAEYEVRVLGLNRGDPGDPSSSARATPRALGPGNRAPVAIAALEDRTLILGAALAIDLGGAFWDPDGDALAYTARSLRPSVLEASVSGAELRLRAVGVGPATVYVYATDPGGLVGSQTLRARVVDRAALSADDAQAPEGGAARLSVRLSPARSTSTRIVWTLAPAADAATADADDLVETSGEATIPAGETRIEIAIAIADDDEIEPAREWFEVSLSAPDGCCGPAARARVTVLEGVCDRTPAVRDALRGSDSCTAPTPATLAAVERLELSGAGAGSLRAGDFGGLSGLHTLLLDGNGLRTLPDGLFAGLDSLGELSLEDNPGAPFALAVELARTDADAWAPGPATVRAQFALGAPFALRSELSARPMAAGLPETVEIEAGATFGAPFAVASTSTLRLVAGPAPLPTARCGEAPCFRGVEAAPGEALTLYRRPPQAQPAPTPEPLRDGDDLRLALGSLIRPGDGDPADLRWRASSSDESVATARVVGGRLVVTPAPGGEGTARIVLEVVDGETGLAATLRFDVQVEFHWPVRQASGWRAGALIEAARAASEPAQ